MSNKPPGVKIDGIRGSIPAGYLLGRVDPGHGPVQLISQAKAQSAGLIPASLPGPPTGAAGGDLSGTYPNPSVVALRGNAVAVTAPDTLDVLAWSGTAWAPLDLATVAYTGNYTDLIGLPAIHNVPAGGTAGQALTKVDGTDYNLAWSTISGGSGGGAASIYDDGSNLYVALSDADGQLVLDGSGDPVFSLEVLPIAAIPSLNASQIGSGNLDLARAPTLNGTRVFTLLGAAYNNHVSGPTTIDMMGLGGTLVITPAKTGRVRVRLSGWLSVNTASISDQGVRLYYGTGTAPATHAGATGTLATPDYLFFAGAAFQKTFTLLETEITGLTLGTAYWVDVGCYSDGTTVMNVRWNSAIVEEF